MEDSIRMMYCKEHERWYWTSDGEYWNQVGEFIDGGGKNKDHRPKADDIHALESILKLSIAAHSKFPVGKTACSLCKSTNQITQ